MTVAVVLLGCGPRGPAPKSSTTARGRTDEVAATPTASDPALPGILGALSSADVLAQNDAVAAVIEIGPAAVPSLLAWLDQPGVSRDQVMYALARIGDARAQPAFRAGLKDKNERVRAYAAQGLVRIGDPNALPACLETLNDAADELHADRTPSVVALGEMGLRPVPALLDLLLDDDRDTRMHAERALESIVARRHGFRPGQGFPDAKADEAMRSEWQANGDYQFDADRDRRARAVAKWRKWLKSARLGEVLGRPATLRVADLAALSPMVRFDEVERRLGRGAPTEGPVTIYVSEDRKVDYWFWFFPVDVQAESRWSPENLGLYLVSRGGDGPILWPEALVGRDLNSVFEEYARAHPGLERR